MSRLASVLIVLAGLTGASDGVGVALQSYHDANVRTPISSAVDSTVSAVDSTVITSTEVIGDPFLPEQAQENVLVVPTPDLPVENQAELTEDLSIMCRIFDKSVPAAGNNISFWYGDRADAFRYVLAQQGRGTQGLYLDGYGALFFLRVDYPLAPTQMQEAAQAKPNEPVDSVWSQTVREMSGQSAEEPQANRNTPVYDAQKVENLKKTLVKTLAHASNIRLRRPHDAITLVVGALDEAKAPVYALDEAKAPVYGRSRSTSTTRPMVVRPGATVGGAQPGARHPAPALMILRVTKADVDAFARKQMMLGEFTQKVQILFSPSGSNVPATSGTGPTPVGTRR